MKRPLHIFNLSIQNVAARSVDIHIDGDIVDASTQAMIEAFFGDSTSVSYKSFRNSLNETDADVYNVIINSPGGHVGDALAIYDLLVDLQSKGKTVNTIGRGIVASSATLILLAGKNPEMSANSWFMMHTVSGGTYGTVDQIENYATTMRKFNNSIVDLYSERSGLPKEEVSALMDKETWLSASDAKTKGLISNVSGNSAFSNSIQKENWDFANTAVLNSYNSSVKPDTNLPEDMKKFFTDLSVEIMNAIKGINPTAATTNQELVNSISTAIAQPIENMGNTLDAHISTMITDAITPLTSEIADLKKKNTDLEADIVNNLGGKSEGAKGEKAVIPVGSYS